MGKKGNRSTVLVSSRGEDRTSLQVLVWRRVAQGA
jgi:hypothetical protein